MLCNKSASDIIWSDGNAENSTNHNWFEENYENTHFSIKMTNRWWEMIKDEMIKAKKGIE